MPWMSAPNLPTFRDLALPGGFILSGIALVPGPMIDPIGRSALARTVIEGRRIAIVLEGLIVAVAAPPAAVVDFCEGDFEREAKLALQRFGVATPESVIAFLNAFDFA
jgi:hypothetical protein